MTRKNELLLQVFFICITGLFLSLIFAKLYPESYFKQKRAEAVNNNKKVLSESLSRKKTETQEIPIQINIPSAQIELPVAPGIITNDEWTLYEDKATWLSTSDTPGNGNVIIYAHNWDMLFGNLKLVSVGDTISVKTKNKTYIYRVVSRKNISPKNTEALISEKNELTLYTCDGYLDEWRILIKAEFIKAV